MKLTFLSILAILVSGLAWLFSDSLPIGSEVTVYRLFCKGVTGDRQTGLPVGQCQAKEETANPTTFKVFVERQTVVYWTGENDTPYRLRHCAVRDARNWSCQLGEFLEEEPAIEWHVRDGELRKDYSNLSLYMASGSRFYSVSKRRWWWVRLVEELGIFPLATTV